MENLLVLKEAPEEFVHFWEDIRGQKIQEFPKSNIENAIKRHRVPGIFPDCNGGDKENSM